MAGLGPLRLLSGGVTFQLSVLGAWGLKVDVPRRIETGNSQRRAVLRGRPRPTAARRLAVLSLLGGRPARSRGLAGEGESEGAIVIMLSFDRRLVKG